MNFLNVKIFFLALFIAANLTACGSDVGGNEDKTSPTTALTSLNRGEEVIGAFNLTWTTNDPNPSTVDIFLSSDSGASYPTIVDINVPDTGRFSWDSNTVDDCRHCRIRIIPQDVVGNTGAPVESAEDFIINNVPQVLGVAYYADLNNNGFDGGDEIHVPFDKALEIRTSIASDIFFFPVLGDNIGPFSAVRKGENAKELIITMNDIDTQNNYRLHIHGAFKPNKLGLTFPSGINLQDNISAGIIFAPDTGKTAAIAEVGIDILPTFSDSGQNFTNGQSTRSIALADIDGDGDLDIVAGNIGVNAANRVWINGGDNSGNNTGVFTDSGQALGTENTQSIALGDVDGDGDLDIVAGNSRANSVWINGGDSSGSNTGIFTDSGQALGNEMTTSIVLGDIDDDGDLDIVTGNNGVNVANRVWINGGDNSGNNTGVFTDSGQALGTENTQSIALGDVDGDGDLDIVAGNSDANRVWINDGDSNGSNTGIFTDSGQALGSENTQSIALGDVDGDGDLDIVAGNNGNNRVWINGGNDNGNNTGVFTSGQVFGTKFTLSIALGDIDDDGDLDILTGNSGGPNRVWINGGNSSGSNTGIFTDSGQALDNETTPSIALGDIDGDGDLDIIMLGNGDLNLVFLNTISNGKVWLNSLKYPSATFIIDSGQALGTEFTHSIALGDVDGDGDLDMVTGNNSANHVWINGGDSNGSNTGIFVDSGQALGNGDTQSIVLGDIDGDGDLDIVTGNGNSNNTGANRVWINGGDSSGSNTGIFTDSSQALGSENTRSIVLGDIDDDGDLDIVAGNDGVNIANRVWINGGDSNSSNTGIFTDSGQELGSENTQSIALGDVDDDGDLDIVTGNNGNNRVWINGGDDNGSNTGVFTDSGQALGNEFTQSIALGDIDNDGDLDIVTGSSGNNRVWINGGDDNANNTGVFTESGQALGNEFTQSIALGDIDNDGDLDIIEGNRGANRVWINGSNNNDSNMGIFTDSGQALSNGDTQSITLGDLDSDGDLEIITGNDGANRVWLNDF